MGVLAFGIQFFIGIRHFNEKFGQLCILESIFALSGVFLLDLIHGKSIYPKMFKKIHGNLLFRTIIIFIVIALIQFIFQVVPLTVRDVETALAIVFCGVSEELFFRGIIMEPFFLMGKHDTQKFKIGFPFGKPKEISFYEIFGIFLTSALFTIFHVNYYGNPSLILMVGFGGLWLVFAYWFWKDITACILAHFLLNIIFVAQFYRVWF
ncbi:MAG: CPBP family intramembrane glutamic endopeptidase [Candidatus Hermodarchaeota archaeon]